MGKTGTEFIQKMREKSHITRVSECGKEYSQVSSTKKPEGPPYKIEFDTAERFKIDQVISESDYECVKRYYDIRMKDWMGDSEERGKKMYYVSGKKRHLIKDFLLYQLYNVNEQPFHYIVTGNKNKISSRAILEKIQEMGLKFLCIHVISETGYDRAFR